jgi:tetratricopeptide (TPR) repeat protein
MVSEADRIRAQALLDNVDMSFRQAKTEQQRRQWAETHLPMLNEAVSLDPDNSNAWNGRGSAKYALEDYQGAIVDYTKAIDLNPNNAAAWNNRGSAKHALGDHDGAIADLDEAIRLNPNNDAAWNNRGSAKYRLEKFDEAISDYHEALELNPNNQAASNNLQAALISKLRQENSKNSIERKNKTIERVEKEVNDLKNSLWWYRVVRVLLFIILFVIIFGYFFGVLDFLSLNRETLDTGNAASYIYALVARVSTVSLLVFPIVWAIRLTNQAITNAHILRFDLFSRMTVENSLDYYSREIDDKKNDLILDYMDGWMNKNPGDKLVSLQKKKLEPSSSPPKDFWDQIKALLNQLINKTDKPDIN